LTFNSCWKDSDFRRGKGNVCDWFQQTAFKTESKEKFSLPFVVGIFFKADIREESPCRVKAISALQYLSNIHIQYTYPCDTYPSVLQIKNASKQIMVLYVPREFVNSLVVSF
jgi:hypothetical protein